MTNECPDCSGECAECGRVFESFEPACIVLVQGTPTWDAIVEALYQFTENTGCFVEDEEPEDHPQERENLKHATVVLDKMNAALAALAELPS